MNKKIAFVFPGQGSQSVGMLASLAEENKVIEKTFNEASEALGVDLWHLSQKGPLESLNQTELTQPALLAASVALWRLWCEKRPERPVILAGHSLGEYSALVCAGSLDFSDAIRLVSLRGKLMQSAVPEGLGAMAAILGLNAEAVTAVCETAKEKEIVYPANYNSPEQIVISGHAAAVLRAMEIAKIMGAKRVIRLPVSVPSHCELMKPAALLLAEALKKIPFKLPNIPVIHNVDATECKTVEGIQQALVNQLYQPVRWVETVQSLAERGITTLLECGPGTVLSGLNKRIAVTLLCQSLSNGEAYALT
jgi:[acyl-carrier-protein] S-malonyltransferase